METQFVGVRGFKLLTAAFVPGPAIRWLGKVPATFGILKARNVSDGGLTLLKSTERNSGRQLHDVALNLATGKLKAHKHCVNRQAGKRLSHCSCRLLILTSH